MTTVTTVMGNIRVDLRQIILSLGLHLYEIHLVDRSLTEHRAVQGVCGQGDNDHDKNPSEHIEEIML